MRTGLTILVFVLFSFMACENDEPDFIYGFDVVEEFRMYNRYTSSNGEFTFVLREISDSRCPKGATCIWQGEARLRIEIENLSADALNLSTYNNVKDTVGKYSIELIDVLPYPEIGKEIKNDEYRISLIVSEVN